MDTKEKIEAIKKVQVTVFFGRFVTRNPAGVNLIIALVGLLTYSVFYAFPALIGQWQSV